MRHLLGVVLGVIAGAALFFGVGWVVAKLAAINGSGEKLASAHGAEALAAVGGTALLIGLLIVIPRVLLLAAGLAGLAALGFTAWWVEPAAGHRARPAAVVDGGGRFRGRPDLRAARPDRADRGADPVHPVPLAQLRACRRTRRKRTAQSPASPPPASWIVTS